MIDAVVIYNRDRRNTACVGGNLSFYNCSSRLRGFRMEILQVVDGNESVEYTYNDLSPTDPGLVISLDIPSGIVENMVRISLPGVNGYLFLRS